MTRTASKRLRRSSAGRAPWVDTGDTEDRCRRCGVSCHLSVPVQDLSVVVPGLHCRYLEADGDGRFRCSVYAERFARAPWCHSALDAAPLGYLAADCPYGSPAGQGKVRLDDERFAQYWPAILGTLRAWGVPSFVARSPLLTEVERREGRPYRLEPWPGQRDRLRLLPVL